MRPNVNISRIVPKRAHYYTSPMRERQTTMWPPLVIAVVVMIIGNAVGYPSGAPAEQCNLMTPNHDAAVSQQFNTSPYTISLSASTYGCKGREEINVTLSGTQTFKGFLCQARTNVNVSTSSGILTANSNTAKSICGSSITHTSSETKNSLSFQWKPASNENVVILCTLVQNKTIFWVKQPSAEIIFSNSNCEATTRRSGSVLSTTSSAILLISLLFYVKLFSHL